MPPPGLAKLQRIAVINAICYYEISTKVAANPYPAVRTFQGVLGKPAETTGADRWASILPGNINARMGNLEVQLVKIESRITGLENSFTGLENSFAVFDRRLAAVEIAVTK